MSVSAESMLKIIFVTFLFLYVLDVSCLFTLLIFVKWHASGVEDFSRLIILLRSVTLFDGG